MPADTRDVLEGIIVETGCMCVRVQSSICTHFKLNGIFRTRACLAVYEPFMGTLAVLQKPLLRLFQ